MSQVYDQSPIIILGNEQQSGCYILRMRAQQPLQMHFGRFKGGKEIALRAGEYLYVGSALGAAGATSLAKRLVRHATRPDPLPPHPIRAAMLTYFHLLGLGKKPLVGPTPKKLFWHIDYVLQPLTVDLVQIFAIRTTRRLEPVLAQLLADEPYTFIIEKGLGASDHRGHTHLLGVQADDQWWAALVTKLQALVTLDD